MPALLRSGLSPVLGVAACLLAVAVPPAVSQSTSAPSTAATSGPSSAGGAAGGPVTYDRLRVALEALGRGQMEIGAETARLALAATLQRSRDSAREISHPIPEQIRRELEPYFGRDLLANVRYAVGDAPVTGVARIAIRAGQAAAVTLGDTIVFKDERYLTNVGLWAHELHHVQQYAEWGMDGFAARYAFNWEEVEAEARARAADFSQWRADR